MSAICLALVAAAPLTVSFGAAAQTEDELDQARQLFDQGLTLEAARDWPGALATFEKVGRVKMTAQVRFHIARCKEHLGRLNEALGGYRLAEHEAMTSGAKPDVLDPITEARKDLEERIPKLVIERGKNAEHARFELDGVAVGADVVGIPMNLDPGPHTIVAIAPNGEKKEFSVSVAEGEIATVPVHLPAKASTAPLPPPNSSDEVGDDIRAADDEFEQPEEEEPPPAKLGPAPWIAGGIGIVGVGAGAAFLVLRNQAKAELDFECEGRVCPNNLQDTQDQGELYSTLAPISIGVGVVGLGVSIALFARGGTRETNASRWWNVDAGPRRDGAGVSFSGRF